MLFKPRKPLNPNPRQPANRSAAWQPSITAQPRRARQAAGNEARQRNTPAAPNQAFSYHAVRSQSEVNLGREAAQNKPVVRRLPGRLQRLRRHAGWLAGGMVVLGLALYQLQLSSTPRIVTLSASSNVPFLQDTVIYQRAAHDMLSVSAVNRNKLTVDTTTVSHKLQTRFPELAEASISLPLIGDQPTLYIRPAEPALVLAATNGAFIIDENGRALAQVSGATDTSQLHIPSVTDQSQLAVKLGDQVLPSTVTGFVASVLEQLKSQQLTVQSMILPPTGGELDVYIANQPYFVKFNVQDLREGNDLQQIGTFMAVIKRLKGAGTLPSQYVDVRTQGRAYYL